MNVSTEDNKNMDVSTKDFYIAMLVVFFTLLFAMPFMKPDAQDDSILERPQHTHHATQEKIVIDESFSESDKYFLKSFVSYSMDIAVLMVGFYLGTNITKIRKHPNYKRNNVASIPMTPYTKNVH